jgi:hypothetical protein
VHRRDEDGLWTTRRDVGGEPGTRGILMLSESDALAHLLYTRWGAKPYPIVYCSADLEALRFGPSRVLLSAETSLDNVTGTKQPLPAGALVAVAEGSGHVWWNDLAGSGSPADSLAAPAALVAEAEAGAGAGGARVRLAWTHPNAPAALAYDVYRQVDGGDFVRLNAAPLLAARFEDTAAAAGALRYRVTAQLGARQSGPSASAQVFLAPPAAAAAIGGMPTPTPRIEDSSPAPAPRPDRER